MLILGIDPGTRESGVAVLNLASGNPSWARPAVANDDVLDILRNGEWKEEIFLACEMVGHYGTGMSVGREVYETVVWIGRFQEAWESRGRRFQLIIRKEITAHLCRSVTAKDANVRQALIDLWGGESLAIGGKKCPACKGTTKVGRGKARESCLACCETPGWLSPPGPLCGISAHAWQALGVAVTCRDLYLSPSTRGTAPQQPAIPQLPFSSPEGAARADRGMCSSEPSSGAPGGGGETATTLLGSRGDGSPRAFSSGEGDAEQ